MGQRILKLVNTGGSPITTYTYYQRDPQGNVIATYSKELEPNHKLSEFHIYGSSRLGIKMPKLYRNTKFSQGPQNSGEETYEEFEYEGNATSTATGTNYSSINLSGGWPSNARLTSLYSGLSQYEITNHLGNVLTTIKDEPLYASAATESCFADRMIKPLILTATDYYPFGMPMPNRQYSLSSSKYRFGFNTQEKDDEVYGEGNLNTAEFWQYDTRIGRRWNVDPKYNAYESRYAVNGNNPLYYNDPNGDYKTGLAARLANLFRKGEVKQAKGGKRDGQYYFQRSGTPKGDPDDKGVNIRAYRPDFGDGKIDKYLDKSALAAKIWWNSPMMRYKIADYYTYQIQISGGPVARGTTGFGFTLITRGKTPGLYGHATYGAELNTSAGFDAGVQGTKGYYLGVNMDKFDKDVVAGTEVSGSVDVGGKVGIGWQGGVTGAIGYDKNGPTTISYGASASLGEGISLPSPVQASVGYSNTQLFDLIKMWHSIYK